MKNVIHGEIKDDRVVPNASVVLEPYKTEELADEARNCRSGHVIIYFDYQLIITQYTG